MWWLSVKPNYDNSWGWGIDDNLNWLPNPQQIAQNPLLSQDFSQWLVERIQWNHEQVRWQLRTLNRDLNPEITTDDLAQMTREDRDRAMVVMSNALNICINTISEIDRSYYTFPEEERGEVMEIKNQLFSIQSQLQDYMSLIQRWVFNTASQSSIWVNHSDLTGTEVSWSHIQMEWWESYGAEITGGFWLPGDPSISATVGRRNLVTGDSIKASGRYSWDGYGWRVTVKRWWGIPQWLSPL